MLSRWELFAIVVSMAALAVLLAVARPVARASVSAARGIKARARVAWTYAKPIIRETVSPVVPHLRSRTNWMSIIQFLNVFGALGLSQGEIETGSARAWLAFSIVVLILGFLYRARARGSISITPPPVRGAPAYTWETPDIAAPAMGPGAQVEAQEDRVF